MTTRTTLLALATLALAAGCTPPAATDDVVAVVDLDATQLLDHRTALGVLALVNDAQTDVGVLTGAVGLPEHAAVGIVAHRRGADALDGTLDDAPFRTIAQLDAVSYVGEGALALLGEAAAALGYVPAIFVEGVPFSEQDAHDVLFLANAATLVELDEQAGLDARAAASLVAGRPFADLVAVGEAAWVGPAALESMKAFAPSWLGDEHGGI